jgi:cytoskeletal protein CcmA (bactofilin family)
MTNSGELKDARAATVGVSVSIKGEIEGSEDIMVDGQVEGRIDVPEHMLTIGPNARVRADIHAKTVIVFGSVIGTVIAEEKAEIRKTASVDGALTCGCLSVQEGATITGMIETMNRRAPADRAGAERAA